MAQRHLAVLICAAALLLKLVVPTGYMIDGSRGYIAVTICSGTSPRTMVMTLPGMHGDRSDHGNKGQEKAEMPCAFSGLSAAALSATDPILLAALVAFVTAVGFAGPISPLPVRRVWLRPPLRGPPSHR